MTLEELVGQKLVLGIEGSRVTPEAVDLFRKTHAGGLIIFRRNCERAEALRSLIADLEQALGRRLVVMIDHEGGRVIHIGDGVSIFPDARAAGESSRPEWVKRQGEIEGEELRRLGMDVNLAPVLDILVEAWNPAIGNRSYGKDPQVVAKMGQARIEGMQSRGLSACAKHWPGLGEARFDPHRDLPSIQKSWKAMKQTDLVPFAKAIEGKVDCVMSSYPLYPELDNDSLPATFSRRIIHDYLRLEFGFDGVILTDDLKMGAISKTVSFREVAPLAAKAGHDLLLVCSDPKAQLESFESLVWAYKKKELKTSELEESVERIRLLKEKRPKRFAEGPPIPHKEGKELAHSIARAGANILNNGLGLLPLSPEWCLGHSVLAIFPNLEPLSRHFFIEPELLEMKNFIKSGFQRFGISLGVEAISLDPGLEESAKIKKLSQEQDLVIFFCGDAHLFPGTREFLKAIQESSQRLAVVLLREPQDAEWVLPGVGCITSYGFRSCQIETAIEKLFSPT